MQEPRLGIFGLNALDGDGGRGSSHLLRGRFGVLLDWVTQEGFQPLDLGLATNEIDIAVLGTSLLPLGDVAIVVTGVPTIEGFGVGSFLGRAREDEITRLVDETRVALCRIRIRDDDTGAGEQLEATAHQHRGFVLPVVE